MNGIWQINNWKAILLAYQLGYKYNINLKRMFPSFIFKEIFTRHPDWVTYLGGTELSLTELSKEYASHGKKSFIY